MGKLPFMKFYPNDWGPDLEEHPLEIEGAWIRIVCKLWHSPTRGTMTKTLGQWAKILRVSEQKAADIIGYIHYERIGEVLQSVTDNNIIVTIQCRRRLREEKARRGNAERQRRWRERQGDNAPSNGQVTGRSHITDTREKPFECKFCGKIFLWVGEKYHAECAHCHEKFWMKRQADGTWKEREPDSVEMPSGSFKKILRG